MPIHRGRRCHIGTGSAGQVARCRFATRRDELARQESSRVEHPEDAVVEEIVEPGEVHQVAELPCRAAPQEGSAIPGLGANAVGVGAPPERRFTGGGEFVPTEPRDRRLVTHAQQPEVRQSPSSKKNEALRMPVAVRTTVPSDRVIVTSARAV